MSTTKYKHKEGRGSLFKNTYKDKDTQPDLRGTMTDLQGKEFEISAWEGQTQAGDYKLSIQMSEPYQKTEDKTKDKEEKDNLPF
tara:strand:- start:240 stop:491 length:252 start_codon:yes stop_codon:yes gene_type:complete